MEKDLMKKFVHFAKQANYVSNFGLYNPKIIECFIQDPSTQFVFNCLTFMAKKDIRTSPDLCMFDPNNMNDRKRIIGFASGALTLIVKIAESHVEIEQENVKDIFSK